MEGSFIIYMLEYIIREKIQMKHLLSIVLILFFLTSTVVVGDTPQVPNTAGNSLYSTGTTTINGNMSIMVTTTYTVPVKTSTIRELYESPLPPYCQVNRAEITAFEIYQTVATASVKKSSITLSDGYSKTIKCYYYYAQIPFKPALHSFVSVWGKPWVTPKIEIDGVAIAKK